MWQVEWKNAKGTTLTRLYKDRTEAESLYLFLAEKNATNLWLYEVKA